MVRAQVLGHAERDAIQFGAHAMCVAPRKLVVRRRAGVLSRSMTPE
jgi:hypothetical protein